MYIHLTLAIVPTPTHTTVLVPTVGDVNFLFTISYSLQLMGKIGTCPKNRVFWL
jgi:hypothetical protein